METYNVCEECMCHRFHRIWMGERNEVAVLAEAIHHHEDDRFAADSWQRLHKINVNVRPDRCWNGEWKEKACWV
jgi:hypothetical protein